MPWKSMIFLLMLLLTAVPGQAQPTRDRVLGDVEINEQPEAAELVVVFNFPVRYLGHFPAENGTELRIQLQPISIATVDRSALFHRESYTPQVPNLAGLTEILYEGDTYTGLFLTIYFQNPASWQVTQGADYRSLQILIKTPFPATP